MLYYGLITFYGVNAQLANFLGYICAVSLSYIGQRKWTFQHVRIEKEHIAKLKFFISSLFSLLLNALWVFLIIKWLNKPPHYSLFGIVFLTPLMTFFILKLWVFKTTRI